MRVTQQDIARMARVSQATVSRVLAGDARVESHLRLRVLEAMEKKKYFADSRARSLRSRQAHLIGLVLKRPQGGLKDDPFFSRLISEITSCLSGTPYHLCIDIATSAEAQTELYEELLRTRRVDGLLVVEPEASDPRMAQLQKDQFPFVVIGNPGSVQVDSVDNDNVLAGRMAALHLVEGGFRSVGFLAGPKGVHVSDDRLMGYSLAMREHHLAEQVYHSDFGIGGAEERALAILGSADRPRALVVLDDFMAMGVSMAARMLGLKIPEDLALVSFNDTSLCQAVEGGLTSVNLKVEQIVSQALSILTDRIENGGPETVRSIVPCELKVRKSSQSAARAGKAS
jgi:DNA-binding LacI/PurR family transcriptional regulator